jgi:hypothetical protein
MLGIFQRIDCYFHSCSLDTTLYLFRSTWMFFGTVVLVFCTMACQTYNAFSFSTTSPPVASARSGSRMKEKRSHPTDCQGKVGRNPSLPTVKTVTHGERCVVPIRNGKEFNSVKRFQQSTDSTSSTRWNDYWSFRLDCIDWFDIEDLWWNMRYLCHLRMPIL